MKYKKDERDRRAEARELIARGLRAYDGGEGELDARSRTEELNSTERRKELTVAQINDGVLAFVLYNKMGGGSVGDVDLYALLQEYLLSPEKRKRINEVVNELCLPIANPSDAGRRYGFRGGHYGQGTERIGGGESLVKKMGKEPGRS